MEIKPIIRGLCLCIASQVAFGDAKPSFVWPDGARAAISLGYDDALDSHLDVAVPALDKHGFKASFYVPVARPVLSERMSEWRAIAKNGHELGNHTIFHQCDASLPDRDWVKPYHDLTKMSVEQMRMEILVANNILSAIDGKTERTFTTPCGDVEAGGENYIEAIKEDFVAIKTAGEPVTASMEKLDPYYVGAKAPIVSGEELIAIVEEAATKGTMANITFHGVGGDYLSVSKKAHDKLLVHLAKHPETYWVDTFLNIMTYVQKQQKKQQTH